MASALNEQAILAAFLRTRQLAGSCAPVCANDARGLERLLRPVAGVSEVQQVMVPLLDRAGLPSLAMAWDCGPGTGRAAWLFARVERWLKLQAPEFAFLSLAELRGQGAMLGDARERAQAALARERGERSEVLERNMSALSEADRELAGALRRSPRSTVALRPLGSGLGEFSGQGAPLAQIWAATAQDAVAEAERIVSRAGASGSDVFIAGVGDCTLPAVAARAIEAGSLPAAAGRSVHLVEPSLARVRALFETADVSGALRCGSLRLHAGAQTMPKLAAAFGSGALTPPDAIAGGDMRAISWIRLAAARGAVAAAR